MRTTLTLDDDVAALVRKRLQQKNTSLKTLVNCALRAELVGARGTTKRRQRIRLRPVSMGECVLPSLDNISEVLEHLEGKSHK